MTKTYKEIKDTEVPSNYELVVLRQGFTTDEGQTMCVACAYGFYFEEEQVAMSNRNKRVQPCYMCDFCNEPLHEAISHYDEVVKEAMKQAMEEHFGK